jgi:hypothetical protein
MPQVKKEARDPSFQGEQPVHAPGDTEASALACLMGCPVQTTIVFIAFYAIPTWVGALKGTKIPMHAA